MSKVKPSPLSDPITRLGLEWTYEQVLGILDQTADLMARRLRGDREEFRLRARDIFIDTFLSYRPKRSNFIRHLRFRLRTRLLNLWKKDERFYRMIEVKDPRHLYWVADRNPPPAGDVTEIVRGAGYVLDARFSGRKATVGRATLRTLRGDVRDRMLAKGWSQSRITEAMDAAATLFGREGI